MAYFPLLKYGSTGEAVLYLKESLYALGYFADDEETLTSDRVDARTVVAIRAFQAEHKDTSGTQLVVDGIVGKKTWGALEQVLSETVVDELPGNIGDEAKAAILPALTRVRPVRREIVLHALLYAFDPDVGGSLYPLSLYIRGENLYNVKLQQVVITKARIIAGAKAQPQYYSGGRMQMMLAAVSEDPSISGADCSGGIVGLLRKHKLVKPTFDATANQLCGGKYGGRVAKSALLPGDFVGRSGHIGLYAGGGYAVEWMGGAYGCQLTRISAREGYNFVTRKMSKKSAWTKFVRVNLY